MPKASPALFSFNGGELTPRLEGRVDLDKYKSGCKTLTNFTPQVQGPALKRSGSKHVIEVENSAEKAILIDFEFNVTQAYVIIMQDQKFWIARNGGIITETPIDIDSCQATNPYRIDDTAHTMNTGDTVFIDADASEPAVRSRFFQVTDADPNFFTLDGEDGSAYSTGGLGQYARVVQVTTNVPWLEADLDGLFWWQSGDVLYLTHPDHPPHKITRTSHTVWTSTEIDFNWQPFASENEDLAVTMFSDAATGTGVTITASSATFVSGDVGRYLRLRIIPAESYSKWTTSNSIASGDEKQFDGNVYVATNTATTSTDPPVHTDYQQIESDGSVTWQYLHSGTGYVKITVFTSSTVVTADVIREIPSQAVGSGNLTRRWAFGAWDTGTRGYPRCGTFFEDRLWFGGTAGNPQTFWGSRTGDYENHAIDDTDIGAVQFTLNTDKVNSIEWMSGGKNVMTIGTAGAEFVAHASNADEVITADNIRVDRHSTYGSKSEVKPLRAESVTLFVQRAGKKLREFVFSFEEDTFKAPDLTVLADHITAGRIKQMAFQQEPNRVVWCVLADGKLVAMTYEREQEVVGWHRYTMGGTGMTVESVAVIPSTTGNEDEVWLLVKRTINSGTVRYVEQIQTDWVRENDVEDAFFVDSGLTFDGSPITEIFGLNHLEGEAVDVLADGIVITGQTVASGKITLATAASVVQIGLTFNAILETMRLEAGAADGTAQGKIKRITHVAVRLDQTGPGLLYGSADDEPNMDEFDFRDGSLDLNDGLIDGDTRQESWPFGYEQDANIVLKHVRPTPCTITMILPQLNTQDGG